MVPELTVVPKTSTAQATSETSARRSVAVMQTSIGGSVDRVGSQSYFTSEWAAAGSHVIEPTGPMKGPNAVADVMPLGGRQMSW